MLLSNHLIYENRLKCGSEAVANQSLVLPNRKACAEWCKDATCSKGDEGPEECWIQGLMNERYVSVRCYDACWLPSGHLDVRANV